MLNRLALFPDLDNEYIDDEDNIVHDNNSQHFLNPPYVSGTRLST